MTDQPTYEEPTWDAPEDEEIQKDVEWFEDEEGEDD